MTHVERLRLSRLNPGRIRFLPIVILSAFALSPVAQATEVLHLDRCVGNCTYHGAFTNDSCTNASQLVDSGGTVVAFSHGDDAWNELVACVRSVLEPYDVEVVEPEPESCDTPYWEIAVAGVPTNIGISAGVKGAAPFTCAVIPGAPAFAFANIHDDMLDLCWTTTHMFGNLLGLDSELAVRDPMSYQPGCLVKRFAPADVPCGESTPRACCTTESTQNSDAVLRDVLGTNPVGAIFADTFEEWVPSPTGAWAASLCHWDTALGGPP